MAPPLPISTNVPNHYNDGGDQNALEFAPPVLPEVHEVPPMTFEYETEQKLADDPAPNLPQTDSGLLKMADFSRKVRDLELQMIDSSAQTERKFNAMREALFSRLERDIKTISGK